jgi:3-oxoacyl-[acyl-carrier-protein] synthase II
MPPISSIKSIFGHTLGAAGALDAIVSIVSLQRQILPPTVGCDEQPEVEGWDFVTGRGRPVSGVERVVTTNSGFAGNNTALIFRRCTRTPDPTSTNVRDRPASVEPVGLGDFTQHRGR